MGVKNGAACDSKLNDRPETLPVCLFLRCLQAFLIISLYHLWLSLIN